MKKSLLYGRGPNDKCPNGKSHNEKCPTEKVKKTLNKPKNVTILRTKAITPAVTGQIYIRTCFINAC